METEKAFDFTLKQNWLQCQIIGGRCVSNQQSKRLIAVGKIGKDSFENIICVECAEVLGIKNGEKIPKNAEDLLNVYWRKWKKHKAK